MIPAANIIINVTKRAISDIPIPYNANLRLSDFNPKAPNINPATPTGSPEKSIEAKINNDGIANIAPKIVKLSSSIGLVFI